MIAFKMRYVTQSLTATKCVFVMVLFSLFVNMLQLSKMLLEFVNAKRNVLITILFIAAANNVAFVIYMSNVDR